MDWYSNDRLVVTEYLICDKWSYIINYNINYHKFCAGTHFNSIFISSKLLLIYNKSEKYLNSNRSE